MSRRKKKSPPRGAKPPAAPSRLGGNSVKAISLAICAIALVGSLAWWAAHRHENAPAGVGSHPPTPSAAFQLEPEKTVFARYAGPESCRECHAAEFEKWKGSHHGLAERPLDPQLDRAAFEPPREIKAGSQVSEARMEGGQFQLVTAGLRSPKETFAPARVIGVDPLRQFLVAAERGRWQATELVFDPKKAEWFDVYGSEDRQPGEWGHWTGRGMTWNQMCASCHNTRVRKNYEPATDTYQTAMAGATVGCEACHGPMRAHLDWQKAHAKGVADPTLVKLSRDQMLDACGACHSRRGDLTGDFVPGEKYLDHFALSIPDSGNQFYADGQVHEEDYELTSFLGSKMYAAGARCMDCHEPHTSKNLVEGNALCLRCHGPPVAPAPKIDDPAHSFHQAGQPGSHCVDCHMPETVYMQRHARRDHGFTIPDPLLTKEHNIPNACNRCHADQTADWALERCNQWYGDKMNRPTRTRAEWVAQARAGAPDASTRLLRMLADEKIPLWRAVAVNLLGGVTREHGVLGELIGASRDPSELVRAMAIQALDGAMPSGQPATVTLFRPFLEDSARLVRINSAWALRRDLDPAQRAGGELLHYLNLNRDQPLGLMQWGNYLADRGDSAGALAAFGQAVEWDHGSPPLRHEYAVALSQAGRAEEAATQLAEGVRLAPADAQMRYSHALALNEVRRPAEALAELEKTVALDPQFARAWYNLGLARNAASQPERALEALARAEALDPHDPQAPYAAATILVRLGRVGDAQDAARRALRIAPDYADASQLLRMLSAGGEK